MNKPLVIDASFALRMLLPSPQADRYRALMAHWHRDGRVLCAPALWLYEITSALCKGVHFGQITCDEGQQALNLAQKLGVQLFPPDDAQSRMAFDWTRKLERAAAYDSFYLALAKTLDGELWTADKRLINAAKVSWVHLLDDFPDKQA